MVLRFWRGVLRDHFGSAGRALVTLLSTIVILHSISFVIRNYYPIACWDFWNWVEDYRRYAAGHYQLINLFDQHNEHRIFTARLFLFADALWLHMTGLFPLIANLLLLTSLGALLHRLAATPGQGGPGLPCLFYVACMLSLCHWENLVSPFQITFSLLLVFVCGAAVALTLATRPRATSRARLAFLWLGIVCFALASFSMGSGMLAAPPLLLLLLLRGAPSRRIGLFAASATCASILYLRHFTPIGADANPSRGLLLCLRFAARFAGSALAAYGAAAEIAGFMLLLGAGCMLALLLRQRFGHRLPIRGQQAALLAIAGFAVATATSDAVLRADPALLGAAAPRYGIVSLVLAICTAALVVPRLAAALPGRLRLPATIAATAAAAALLVLVNTAASYDHYASSTRAALDEDGQALRANVDDGAPFGLMDYETIRQRAPTIRFLHAQRLNMFAPRFDAPRWVSARLRSLDPVHLPRCLGSLETAVGLDATRLTLVGWLADAGRKRTADWIDVTGPDGPAAPAAATIARPDLRMHHIGNGFHAGFALPQPYAGKPLWAVGLFADKPSRDCAFAAPPDLGLLMVQNLSPTMSFAPATLAAPPALAGAFASATAAGVWLAPPRPDTRFISTDAGQGGGPGQAAYAVHWSGGPDQALFLPFAAGPDSTGQSFVATLADGTRLVLPAPNFPPRSNWRAIVLPGAVITAHGGAAVTIAAIDTGSGPGHWIAVAPPLVTVARADAARLY